MKHEQQINVWIQFRNFFCWNKSSNCPYKLIKKFTMTKINKPRNLHCQLNVKMISECSNSSHVPFTLVLSISFLILSFYLRFTYWNSFATWFLICSSSISHWKLGRCPPFIRAAKSKGRSKQVKKSCSNRIIVIIIITRNF